MQGNQMNLRALLSELTKDINWSDAALQQQIRDVKMDEVEVKIERMVSRAAILAHAFDVMKDGSFPHPLHAFVHATECDSCNFKPLEDSEYFYLLDVWARLVNVKPTIFTGGAVSE